MQRRFYRSCMDIPIMTDEGQFITRILAVEGQFIKKMGIRLIVRSSSDETAKILSGVFCICITQTFRG